MRTLALALLLAAAVPARAQRAADVPGRPAPVALSETPGGLGLGQLFNSETLKFSQSYEASYSSGALGSIGLGVYTASLRWQPTARLAGRVDVGVMHSPFGASALQSGIGLEDGQPRVFLRNAELAYRPTENSLIHLSVQQSPYGAYASPYGVSPYGVSPYGATRYGLRAGASSENLFFRDGQ